MEQITSEAQIQQVLNNLKGVQDQLSDLLGLAQKIRVKLIIDFTKDCEECGEQSATIREARKIYYNAIDILTVFKTSLENLKAQIDPTTTNNNLNKDFTEKTYTKDNAGNWN